MGNSLNHERGWSIADLSIKHFANEYAGKAVNMAIEGSGTMGTAVGLVFLATFCQKIVDLIKDPLYNRIKDKKDSLMWLNWSFTLLSLAIGVGLAFGFKADLFIIAGFNGYVWWVGRLCTGLAIGAGSTFIYDLLDKNPDGEATKKT